MKINKIFNVYGGNGKYTEAYIEKNKGEYPIISGQTLENGIIGYIDTYDFEFDNFLTYTKDGEKSGTIFKRTGKFSLTSHANALVPKEEFSENLNLEWFRFKYEPIFKSIVIGKFGVPSLPQSILKKFDFNLPSIEVQDIELEIFRRKQSLLDELVATQNKIREKINDLKHTIIKIPDGNTTETLNGESLFSFLKKNSGITEKFIYDNFDPTATDQLPVYNGSESIWGFIPETVLIEDKKALNILKGNFFIIVRKGVNAGHIFYQDVYDETIVAEDAIPVSFKKKYSGKIDPYWFIREYRQIFIKNAIGKFSSATFSNTLLKKMRFKIPSMAFQLECSDLYQNLDLEIKKLNIYLEKLDEKINNLKNSTIK